MTTYQEYVSRPEVRERIEREVAQLRRAAFDRYLFAAPAAVVRRVLRAWRRGALAPG